MLTSLPLLAGVGTVLVLLSTWISAVTAAAMQVSRSSLEARVAGTRREAIVAWYFSHLEEARLTLALVRTLLRMLVFGAVLLAFAEPDAEAGVVLDGFDLLKAAGVTTLILWATNVALAGSIARHVSDGFLLPWLPAVRIAAGLLLPLRPPARAVDEGIRRLAGATATEGQERAEAELLRSIEDQAREGGLDEHWAEMLENVVEFNSTDVAEVMTPRTDIDGLEYTDDLTAIREAIVESGHSRVPVYRENLDDLVGVLYVKDLLRCIGEDVPDFRLEPILRQPIVVPETKPVRELLSDFQRSEVHMAIVVDEYGGTAGIVTIEDVLEEIVGEIQDEHDEGDADVPELVPEDDRAWEVDGRFHVDDLNERLGLTLPEDGEFDTVAGYLLAELGRVPQTGDVFESETVRFTMVMASQRTIERIRIDVLDPAAVRRNGSGEAAPATEGAVGK